MCYVILCLLNINLQIPNKSFSEKPAFEPALLFSRETLLFYKLDFFHFLPSPYARMCVSPIGSFSLFGET